jgi:hypothetical protein
MKSHGILTDGRGIYRLKALVVLRYSPKSGDQHSRMAKAYIASRPLASSCLLAGLAMQVRCSFPFYPLIVQPLTNGRLLSGETMSSYKVLGHACRMRAYWHVQNTGNVSQSYVHICTVSRIWHSISICRSHGTGMHCAWLSV